MNGKLLANTDVCEDTCTYLPVQFYSQYSVRVAVITYFSSLLEMTHFELPRCLEAHNSHKATGEKSFHNTHIFRVSWGKKDKTKYI